MIPLPELKLAIRHALPLDDDTEDGYLTQLEAAAVRHVERSTDLYFGPPEAVTEYLRIEGDPEAWLTDEPQPTGNPPAVEITVEDGGTPVDPGTFTQRGRLLRRDMGWGAPWAPADLAITYTRGYAAGAEPPDARQAVLLLAGHWYETRVPVALGTVAPEVAFTLRDLLKGLRHGGYV